MWRPVRVAIAVGAGVVASLAVAVLGVFVDVPPRHQSSTSDATWPISYCQDWPSPRFATVASSVLSESEFVSTRHLFRPDPRWVAVTDRFGFPFRVLQYTGVTEPAYDGPAPGAAGGVELVMWSQDVRIPIALIPSGFASSIVAYSMLVFAMLSISSCVRRRIRVRRGRCPECGYPAATVCPECGADSGSIAMRCTRQS